MEADFWIYEPVPPSAISLFRMSWQLEMWLREIVYVELRAAYADWESHINEASKKKLDTDKSLSHMTTDHQSQLAYLTFSELWTVVSNTWGLFKHYFPPRNIVDARLLEIKAIRNRVAHCREPNKNDLARMELFLRDLDPGFRTFCDRYTHADTSTRKDGVIETLCAEWQTTGHCMQLLAPDVGWLYTPDPFAAAPKLGGRLDRLIHPANANCDSGVIYRLTARGIKGWQLDIGAYVESTECFRESLIHWMISDEEEISVTIPACAGTEAVYTLITRLLHVALNCLEFGDVPSYRKYTKRTNWPEHVLRPSHPFVVANLRESGSIFDLP